MSGPESVGDVDLSELRELVRELGIIVFFARVEAEVLEQENLAVFHSLDHQLDAIAHAVVGQGDFLAQKRRQSAGDGLERELRVRRFPSGRPRWDAITMAPFFDRVLDRGKGLDDALVVFDPALAAFAPSGTLKSSRMNTVLPVISR